MESVSLLPTPYWGRRSGSVYKDGTLAFPQKKWNNGPSGNRAAFHTQLIGVPRKWFGKTYTRKRG